MFQYEKPFIYQDISTKYKIWELRKTRVIERGVCKNDIEALAWSFQIPESICPDHRYLIHSYSPAGILNKLIMPGCHFQGYYGASSPGGKFIGNTSCSGEQIKYICVLDTELMNQDIKETLFCKIGSGPGFEISWRVNLLPPEYTADYAHLLPSERIMKCRICSLVRCSR